MRKIKTKEIESIQEPISQRSDKAVLSNSQRITFKLPVSVKTRFLALAGEKCINISQVLRVAVNDFIKENQ